MTVTVLCIKTSFNIDDSQKIDYQEGKEYHAEILAEDLHVEDESGKMSLAGITAKEAVRLGIQEKENGYWDDWINKHFKIQQYD
ncbi:hypothetical protein [Cytobacillus gottheilii]|uniref:hypothetical protein n=1 Tax=Cytobacillus gottheilii TaxID=859144 RepID=UPI0008331B5B|nr:hypothetical protein [Cytobacillus gottheilii]